MKRNIPIFLAVLTIISATEIHQLLKIPLLFSHYHAHQSTNPSLSFLDFLKIHYWDKHPDDKDDDQDQELPFKSPASIFHIDTPVSTTKIIPSFHFFDNEKSLIAHSDGTPCHRSFSVFHPPRLT
jgi:hypothetical protein